MALTLLPHQETGVQYLFNREPPFHTNIPGCILADDMGVGKTIQTIGLIHRSLLKTTLLICPSTLVAMWKAKLAQFAPTVKVYTFYAKGSLSDIFKDINDRLPEKSIILTTYGLSVRRPELANFKFDRIVCDEAHYFRNKRSKTFNALLKIQATSKLLLTGTPIQNKIQDIITLINFIIGTDQKRTLDFIKLFIQERMLRRKMGQIGITLPNLRIEEILVNGSINHQKLIRTTNRFAYKYPIEKMIRAKQSAVFPSALNNTFTKNYGLPAFNLSNIKSIKIAENILQRNQKCILFVEYVQEIEFFTRYLLESDSSLNVQSISGSTKLYERELFANDTSIDILIIQIAAGGVGLNLQHFNEAHFSSVQWNPAITDQAIGRIKRIGQTKEMNVFVYVFKESFELYIQEVMRRKQKLISTLIM